ncbi:MAG: hypothetical protein ACPG21_06840 [Crocinitomicaceae bacterium]
MSDLENTSPEQQEQKAPVQNESKVSAKQKTRIIISTLLVAFLITFIIQNYNKVKIEFLMFDFQIRIVVIILVSAIIGGLFTYLMMRHWRARKNRK